MSLRELAFLVCTELDRTGTVAVLTGGGAATIYAPDAYQSRDLDFILNYRAFPQVGSAAVLEQLGFQERGQVYRHADTPFTLEFPAGPLAIGAEVIENWDTLSDGNYQLHILSPTDCVRDRLAWFLFGNDYSALEQALAVARRHAVDLAIVRRWCEAEGEPAKFSLFLNRLSQNP